MRTYSIEDLLVGQFYRPQSLARRFMGGEINFVEKRDDVWAGSDFQAYAIRYRVNGSFVEQWATIAVRTND